MIKYSFIIPTLDLNKLKNFKLPPESELIPVVGAKSFFDAWSKGIKKAKGEYLVLTHDDTEYLEFDLKEPNEKAIFGTAGTTVLHKDQPWWFQPKDY